MPLTPTPTETDPLIRIEGLCTHFDTDLGVVRAVDGVSFDIPARQTIGLVGESACGKSVTGLSILRLIQPPGYIAGGAIRYRRNGDETLDLARLDPQGDLMRSIRGGEIAMIFQEPMTSLNPVYTIGQQIAEAIRLHRGSSAREARGEAIEALSHVGLPRPDRIVDEYPHELSGGMRQRAMIAMAISCRPVLLIADEPTTALDVTVQAQILDLLERTQAEFGMAVMIITHDLGVVARAARRIVVMYLGEIMEKGPAAAVFSEPKHPYTQALLRSVPVVGRRVEERLAPVQGQVPDPLQRPPGCPFAPRCPHEMEVCQLRPASFAVGENHEAACWLHE